MRISSLLLLGGLTGLALAQTTVIQYIGVGSTVVPGIGTFTPVPLSGSVVNVNKVATTLSVTDCVWASCEAVIIEGPSTYAYSLAAAITTEALDEVLVISVVVDHYCQITGSTSAVCTNSVYESVSVNGESSTSSVVETLTFGAADIATLTITATAGVSKFNQPQATQNPGAAPRPVVAQEAVAPLGVALAVAVAGLL
jgi:hypothetical protein